MQDIDATRMGVNGRGKAVAMRLQELPSLDIHSKRSRKAHPDDVRDSSGRMRRMSGDVTNWADSAGAEVRTNQGLGVSNIPAVRLWTRGREGTYKCPAEFCVHPG